jgi:hypothetical protein
MVKSVLEQHGCACLENHLDRLYHEYWNAAVVEARQVKKTKGDKDNDNKGVAGTVNN